MSREDMSPKTPATPSIRRGSVIAKKYTLIKKAGSGTFGDVWQADGPEGPVAIKIITRDAQGELGIASIILSELSIQKGLHHPNVAPPLDVMFIGEKVFLVLPWLGGGTLAAARNSLGPEKKLEIAGKILCGLKYIHDSGFLHLDFKPQNALLDEHNNPLITDFGLAQYFRNVRRTVDPNYLITWPYRPPEI